MHSTTFTMDLNSFLFTYTEGEAEVTEARDGSVIYRGWILEFDMLTLPEGFTEIEEWGTNVRGVWKSDADRALICYCEGDISVTVHPDQAAYERELDRCAEFYALYTHDGTCICGKRLAEAERLEGICTACADAPIPFAVTEAGIAALSR